LRTCPPGPGPERKTRRPWGNYGQFFNKLKDVSPPDEKSITCIPATVSERNVVFTHMGQRKTEGAHFLYKLNQRLGLVRKHEENRKFLSLMRSKVSRKENGQVALTMPDNRQIHRCAAKKIGVGREN